MKKTFILGAVLSLASVMFAGQKAYDVIFSAPTTVGSQKLAAGQYTVKVDGSNAVFTNQQSSKSVTAPVKIVDTGAKKFQYTAVDSTKQGDSEKLNAIELAGSSTKLEFGK
ncbi:MAG TPA: hypothetical protein VMH28_30875 [Candidatus Acidoferrales bacterium]|nr:hypothetical protein [Candidatus Acidoferrales bacterium]